MTLLEDAPTTAFFHVRETGDIELVHGLLAGAVFGTNAGVSLHESLRYRVFGLTTVGAAERSDVAVAADEVRRLRDEICQRGLTRQDVARGIGVDRRSLSGYASGEINPQPERMEALRILARVTREIDGERPARVRDVLLTPRGSDTLLNAIASGRYAIAAAWRTWLARLEASVEVRPRVMNGEPVWSAAARALAEGRLAAPSRAATLRPADIYEMDAAETEALEEEPSTERRRRSYK